MWAPEGRDTRALWTGQAPGIIVGTDSQEWRHLVVTAAGCLSFCVSGPGKMHLFFLLKNIGLGPQRAKRIFLQVESRSQIKGLRLPFSV